MGDDVTNVANEVVTVDERNVEELLIEFVQGEIALSDEPLAAETDLLLTGAVDSLGVIRITQWIEDEIGIVVDPGDVTLENFQTVRNMALYVEARSAQRP